MSVSECRGSGLIIIVFDRFLSIFSAVNVNFRSYLLIRIHLANTSADDTGCILSLDRENVVVQRGFYVIDHIDGRATMPQVIDGSRSDVG